MELVIQLAFAYPPVYFSEYLRFGFSPQSLIRTERTGFGDTCKRRRFYSGIPLEEEGTLERLEVFLLNRKPRILSMDTPVGFENAFFPQLLLSRLECAFYLYYSRKQALLFLGQVFQLVGHNLGGITVGVSPAQGNASV